MNTEQFEFDAVVAHLYKQGKPAKAEDGACVYRTSDGLMCAVGCRIPDAVYIEDMEYKNMTLLLGHYASVLPREIVAYEPMFKTLQELHDCWRESSGRTFTEMLDKDLPRVAKNFGLTFTKPQ